MHYILFLCGSIYSMLSYIYCVYDKTLWILLPLTPLSLWI